ncbi:MAG: hypothetical protein EP330_30600 [Deltaproteobacteria bacterium]|nr:MAG: hypothetical protein EP330_30600 [Deltaproteobacteria bacterium]
MRTALLTALLLTAPLAMAEDPPPAEGGEAAAEGEGTEGEEGKKALPEVDMQEAIAECASKSLMEDCEVGELIGLCQLEPCEAGWKDGARACKQCVPYDFKPEAPPPAEPEPMLAEGEEGPDAKEGKAGKKGRRRVKKRDCGCNSSSVPVGAFGLSLLLPLVIRRRQ